MIGVMGKHLEIFLKAIHDVGKEFGMELHPSKFQLLSTESSTTVVAPDGTCVHTKPTMEYLGACLAVEPNADHELNRRIGTAKAVFHSLEKVWTRSALTRKRRLAIFSALVECKLL